MAGNSRRYATWVGTVPAGDRVDIEIAGSFFRLLSGVAGLLVRIDDEPPGVFPVGVGIDCPEPFKRLTVINPTGGDIAIEIAIGRGVIDDARLTVSGVVDVRDPVDQSSFSDLLAGLVAELRDDASKRAALGTLDGASNTYGSAGANFSETVVDAAANVNGVIVRAATIRTGNDAGHMVSLAVAAAFPATQAEGSVIGCLGALKNVELAGPVFVPPGQGVYVRVANGAYWSVWYEVL